MIRPLAVFLSQFGPVRGWLVRYYGTRTSNTGWGRRHPIVEEYGISTSGSIPSHALFGKAQSQDMGLYAGSQPSIVRRALAQVAESDKSVFLDLGCGKGRVLALASEFPFREIIGIELSDHVAAMAEANMAIVRRTFPGRSPIRVVVGNAVECSLPDVPLVIFLYNPFGETSTKRLLTRIETALNERVEPLTIIYYNPVLGAIFDASPWLVRAQAMLVPYDDTEMGFGPDVNDAVVIWQDRRHAAAGPSNEARREILVTILGIRAELAPLPPTTS